MEKLHQLLQKENGLLVKKHSVDLLFLLLNCKLSGLYILSISFRNECVVSRIFKG